MYGEEVVHAEGRREGVVDGHVGQLQGLYVGVLVELQLHFEVASGEPVDHDVDLNLVGGDLVAQVGDAQGGHLQVRVDYWRGVCYSHVLASGSCVAGHECDGTWV